MEKDPKYKVTVRGEPFVLTKSQIDFDAPNYFTMCFLGDFQEAQTRHLELSRDPDLFRIVVDHLCGYKVLPLSERAIPPRMSPALALANLRADASFYLLDGLIKECDDFLKPIVDPNPPKNRYLVLGCTYTAHSSDYVERIEAASAKGLRHWHTFVHKGRLAQQPFTQLEAPEAHSGYEGLRTIAAIERFAASGVQNPSHWRIIGWNINAETIHRYQLMVVLKESGR